MENMMENMDEIIEEKTDGEQEAFNAAMDQICRLAWELTGFEGSHDDMLGFLKENRPALIDLMISRPECQVEDEDDKNDLAIIVEESIIALAGILRKVSEKNRKEFQETFIEG